MAAKVIDILPTDGSDRTLYVQLLNSLRKTARLTYLSVLRRNLKAGCPDMPGHEKTIA